MRTTNIEGIYVGGDVVTGKATIIRAVGVRKTTAKAIQGCVLHGLTPNV